MVATGTTGQTLVHEESRTLLFGGFDDHFIRSDPGRELSAFAAAEMPAALDAAWGPRRALAGLVDRVGVVRGRVVGRDVVGNVVAAQLQDHDP